MKGTARQLPPARPPAGHGEHQLMLLIDHVGNVQLGGCEVCMRAPGAAELVIERLRQAQEFVRQNPTGRDQLDGRW